jgi:hypothetical protein
VRQQLLQLQVVHGVTIAVLQLTHEPLSSQLQDSNCVHRAWLSAAVPCSSISYTAQSLEEYFLALVLAQAASPYDVVAC